jgi:hypothetical protein
MTDSRCCQWPNAINRFIGWVQNQFQKFTECPSKHPIFLDTNFYRGSLKNWWGVEPIQCYMATYFLEFSDQNYGEICYSIRKVPMGQSKFTAQSFQKTATFGRYASAFMVKMDHQMVHK